MSKVNKESIFSLSQRQENVFPEPNLSDFGACPLSLLEAEFKFQRRGESSMRLIIYKPATGELFLSHLFWVTTATGKGSFQSSSSPLGNTPLLHW